jgi:hypothetical protein
VETLTYSSGRASGCDSPGLLNSCYLPRIPQITRMPVIARSAAHLNDSNSTSKTSVPFRVPGQVELSCSIQTGFAVSNLSGSAATVTVELSTARSTARHPKLS